jgi:hypothetical protein
VATYTVQNAPHAGSVITFVSPPANNDIAPCASQYSLMLVNPSGNGTVTVSLPGGTPDGGLYDSVLTVGPRVVSCAQATTTLIPLLPNTYGPTVTLTYTGTLTTVQVAVICVPGS